MQNVEAGINECMTFVQRTEFSVAFAIEVDAPSEVIVRPIIRGDCNSTVFTYF